MIIICYGCDLICSLRKTAVNSNLFTSVLLILLKVWEFLRLYCIIRIPKLCQSPAPTPKVQISKGTTPQNTTPEGEKLRRRRTLLRQARRGRNNEVAQSVIIHVNSLNFLSGTVVGQLFFSLSFLLTASSASTRF